MVRSRNANGPGDTVGAAVKAAARRLVCGLDGMRAARTLPAASHIDV